ncbi:hypothetical protein JTE90_002584 [Oedothorax gibbosus]|uniref:THAP-type domain-containing protein n=1 Tax=Oedothorax gibbosus TaxID=931172 RepID=A0AAV6TT56_9ARAC|nr:hypothetical protein JTE90_002584 [Oedothorax gibbosus]
MPGLHQFPVDKDLCQRWLKLIFRKDFSLNDKSASSVVCSQHFVSSDFIPGLKTRKLKKDAVPTLFPSYPSYKIPSAPSNRRTLVKVNSKRSAVEDETKNSAKKFCSANEAVINSEFTVDISLGGQQNSDQPLETNKGLLHAKMTYKQREMKKLKSMSGGKKRTLLDAWVQRSKRQKDEDDTNHSNKLTFSEKSTTSLESSLTNSTSTSSPFIAEESHSAGLIPNKITFSENATAPLESSSTLIAKNPISGG